MIYLFTGVPGAGKTLNAIKFVDTDNRFKNRPVFYNNIDDCKMTAWTSISLDEAKNWANLPAGAVIVLDEAYKFAPVGATGVRPADYIEKLAEHRHAGVDFILICQHPHQIHTFVRKMIGNHFHIERQFGFNRSRILEWQKVVNDPDDHFARKDALVKTQSFDKQYFGQYKSAEVHTHKPKVPMKLILLGGLLSLMAVGVWAFTDRISSRAEDMRQESSPVMNAVLTGDKSEQTIEQRFANNLPRIPDQPWSAPMYDKLTEPKTFPKPSCVHNVTKNECRCYSQQGTRMTISARACVDIVRYGWFDPTKSDTPDDKQNRKTGESGRQAIAPPSPVRPNFRLVPDSTEYKKLSSAD